MVLGSSPRARAAAGFGVGDEGGGFFEGEVRGVEVVEGGEDLDAELR